MASEALAAPRGPLASRGNEMQPESTTVASPRRRTRRSRADERAYETFHASHYRELAAYCMTDLRNWAEAEEVAADALCGATGSACAHMTIVRSRRTCSRSPVADCCT